MVETQSKSLQLIHLSRVDVLRCLDFLDGEGVLVLYNSQAVINVTRKIRRME